jgi:osmotically-inducible protein OsmY
MTKPYDCGSAAVETPQCRCDHRVLVEQRLGASGYLALRRIDCECECELGVLCLRGCVRSQYLKQVAQTIAAAVEGVHWVDNRIEVVAAESRTTWAGGSANPRPVAVFIRMPDLRDS